MLWMIKSILLGLLLVIQGYIDWKKRRIPLVVSLIGAWIGIVCCLLERRTPNSILGGCAIGILAIVFAKLSREVIGYGDGILLLVMGLYLTFEDVLYTGMCAVTHAGVVALVLISVFHKSGRCEIPFVPFLSIAYLLLFITHVKEVGV